MEAIDTSLSELLDKFHSQIDTIFLDSSIIILDRLEIIPNLLGHFIVAEGDNTLKTIVVLDGEDAWQNRTCDTNGTTAFNKVDKDISIKEQLGDNKISSSINLLLQVSKIIFLVRIVNMAFRVTYHHDMIDEHFGITFSNPFATYQQQQYKSSRHIACECNEQDQQHVRSHFQLIPSSFDPLEDHHAKQGCFDSHSLWQPKLQWLGYAIMCLHIYIYISTFKAASIFSTGILVHVKCIIVSRP